MGFTEFPFQEASASEAPEQLPSEGNRLNEEERLERYFPEVQKIPRKTCQTRHRRHDVQNVIGDVDKMLTTMFSGRFSLEPQKDGSFFIDRDPTHFRLVLNFLRTGTVILPSDQTARDELLLEAEFYNIKQMIDELSGIPSTLPVVNPTASEFTGSSLLREEDKAILLSWLNGKSVWRLIYKASRDGFN